MHTILPEAIIAAFNALGGERDIKEIKEWIYKRYGDKWKNIGTCLADMVPVFHGGNETSQINTKYRVLNKVSRGRYCLLINDINKENLKKDRNNKKESTEEIHKDQKEYKQLLNNPDYFINTSNEKMLEVYASKRLPFEPKGWQLELRNSIRSRLKLLNGNGIILEAMYKSMDPSLFDVENILFYNIGTSAFSHLNIKSLHFERAYEHPTTLNGHSNFKHYQSYKILEKDELVEGFWMKEKTLATWMNVTIPILSSNVKPHAIWHAMKTGSISIFDRVNSNIYGLEVTIKVPIHTQVNLVSIIKPLLDGIIGAFHHHDSTNIDEVVNTLKLDINLPPKQIKDLLLDSSTTILGPRNLIQPYRKGVKWNPKDDAFQFFRIYIEEHHQNDSWIIEGEIFTICCNK